MFQIYMMPEALTKSIGIWQITIDSFCHVIWACICGSWCRAIR